MIILYRGLFTLKDKKIKVTSTQAYLLGIFVVVNLQLLFPLSFEEPDVVDSTKQGGEWSANGESWPSSAFQGL